MREVCALQAVAQGVHNSSASCVHNSSALGVHNSSATCVHNMRAIRKLENLDLNLKYVADVQAMLLEQDNAHGSDSEILDPSDTSDSSDSD